MTTAIILAGGLGTRLREEVPDVPKPMAPINGRPFLEYLMDYWISQGVERFILSIGYKSQIISEHFGGCYKSSAVCYAIEESPLGTGGGLLLALEQVTSNKVLLLNGDTFFAVPFLTLDQFYHDSSADCAFSLFEAQQAGRFMGIDVNAKGKILSLSANDQKIGRLANGGVYLINPEKIKKLNLESGIKISLEDDVFACMMRASSHLFGVAFQNRFIDIGVPTDYRRSFEIIS
jgi:D-glycero-alpha-D-manno-heptose 1-phosphate guanylyltransferase